MAASVPGTPLAPLTVSRRHEIGARPASIGATPALEPLDGELPAERRLDRRGPAALEGRPAPSTADLIVHPLRLSRAMALPEGSGRYKSRFRATARSLRRTGDAYAWGAAVADERTMLR